MQYRKKPVVIEAFRYYIDERPNWFDDAVTNDIIRTFDGFTDEHRFCMIRTLEGEMRGNHRDYIIQGVKGEIYACKPDIFELTYEPLHKMTQKKINNGNKTVQSKEVSQEQKDFELTLQQEAKEYNEKFLEIPEHYKSVNPAPGMVLIKLQMPEIAHPEVTGFHSETKYAQGGLMNWWGFDAHRKGYGIIVAGGDKPFGTEIMVSPAVFYMQNWVISFENFFSSPKHTELGYFLIDRRLIQTYL